MKIYIKDTDLSSIINFLNIKTISKSEYLYKRSRYTGDTYIVRGRWDTIQWAPGDQARIVKKKY